MVASIVEQGVDPYRVATSHVELNGDGRVTLKVYRLNRAGKIYVEEGSAAPAFDMVVVNPTRPFPVIGTR